MLPEAPGKMNAISMLFPKWVTALLSEENFPSHLLGVFNSQNYKISIPGKNNKKIFPTSHPVWKYTKIHSPMFLLMKIFSKVKAPGKGERKDLPREPNFWATAFFPFQVHLFFTPHCREPWWKSSFRRVRSCFHLIYTVWEISPAQVEFHRHSNC